MASSSTFAVGTDGREYLQDEEGFIIPRPIDFDYIPKKYGYKKLSLPFLDKPFFGSHLFSKDGCSLPILRVLGILCFLFRVAFSLFFWFSLLIVFPVCLPDSDQYSALVLGRTRAKIKLGLEEPNPYPDDSGATIVGRRRQQQDHLSSFSHNESRWSYLSREVLECGKNTKGFTLDRLNYNVSTHRLKYFSSGGDSSLTAGDQHDGAGDDDVEVMLDFCYGALTARQQMCSTLVWRSQIFWNRDKTGTMEKSTFFPGFLVAFVLSVVIPFVFLIGDPSHQKLLSNASPLWSTKATAKDFVEKERERQGTFYFKCLDRPRGEDAPNVLAAEPIENRQFFPRSAEDTSEEDALGLERGEEERKAARKKYTDLQDHHLIWEDATCDIARYWPRSNDIFLNVQRELKFADVYAYERLLDHFEGFYKKHITKPDAHTFCIKSSDERPGTLSENFEGQHKIMRRGPRPLEIVRNTGQFSGQPYVSPWGSPVHRADGSFIRDIDPVSCWCRCKPPFSFWFGVWMTVLHLDLVLSLYVDLFLGNLVIPVTKIVGQSGRRKDGVRVLRSSSHSLIQRDDDGVKSPQSSPTLPIMAAKPLHHDDDDGRGGSSQVMIKASTTNKEKNATPTTTTSTSLSSKTAARYGATTSARRSEEPTGGGGGSSPSCLGSRANTLELESVGRSFSDI